MPQYRYAARDEHGKPVSGTLVAPTPEALADQLKRMGYLVTNARPVAEGQAGASWLSRVRRVGDDDLVIFNVQLSKMVQVGIPLVTSLETLTNQTDHPRLRQALSDVTRAVEAGASFSEALQRHPAIFSALFINMVRAGEASGKLDEVLRRLAAFAKRQAELREQVKTAMTYPALLLVTGIAASTFLVLGIIPKFVKIFMEAEVPLPLPTLLLYGLSQALRHSGLGMLLGLAAAWVAAGRLLKTPAGRRWLDQWLLKIPVVGALIRQAAIARLTRTLETLFSSGVPVLESLEIAERTCGNAVIGDVCRTVQANVRQGGTLADPLRASPEFPPMVVQMLAVGEASGTLDHMLGEVADHFDELIRYSLKRLTSLIEPLFLIIMGGMVAFIMASVLLPLFRMVNVIRA